MPMLGGMQTPLLALLEVADRTNLPATWLRREAEAGRIPCLRIGRRLMFDLAAVLKALTDRQNTEGVKRD